MQRNAGLGWWTKPGGANPVEKLKPKQELLKKHTRPPSSAKAFPAAHVSGAQLSKEPPKAQTAPYSNAAYSNQTRPSQVVRP